MAIAATIAVDLLAKTDSFQAALKDTSQRVTKLGEELKSVGQTMTLAVTAPLVGGFIAASRAIDEQEKSLAKLDGVLRATGGAAGVTGDHIKDLAASLQQTTTFGDEVTISGAAVLLTFKGIRNEAGAMNNIFDRTLMVGQDMSALLGTDLQSSMVMLGKAIENPVLGISALTRVGVSFTDEQKETIKTLAESNRTLDAQKLVLQALETQLGGTAQAMAQTVSGQITQAANNFGDQMERMGKAVEPFRLVMAQAMQAAANQMAGMSDNTLAVVGVLGAAAAATGPLVMGMGQLVVSLNAAVQIQKTLNLTVSMNPYIAAAAAIAALAAGMVYAYGKSETFRQVVASVAEAVVSFGKTVVNFAIAPIKALLPVAEAIFSGLASVIGGFVSGAAGLLQMVLPDSVAASVTAFKDNLTGGVRSAVDTAKQIISELRAPSLDLGVTGTNAAAQDALYGPIIQASSNVAQGLTVDFDKARDALGSTTIAVKENTLALIPMEQAMRGNIEKMQSQSRVIMAAEDYQRELNEQIENTTLQMGETSMAFDILTGVMDAFSSANEIAKNRLGGVANSALDMVSKFTPMGIIVEMLSEALEYLMPVVESVIEPFKIIGLVLGKALASILRALFPVIKMVAIAFTYVGQIFFKIAEFLAKAIGYAVYGIGKAIDAIPFVSGKKVIAAGQALIDMGEGFGQAYKDLGNAREEIRGLELPEEKAKESLELTKQSADANKQTAQNTQRIAEALEKERAQPRVQVVIQGGAGRGGTDANADIIRQLDDYFGRSTVYEERAVGRVDSFNE